MSTLYTATEIAKINYPAFAASVGLAYNQVACNGDIGAGVARALGTPGPVLTHVIISYEGRELRWLSALRSNYLRKLPTDQKVRVARRVGVRSLSRHPDDD